MRESVEVGRDVSGLDRRPGPLEDLQRLPQHACCLTGVAGGQGYPAEAGECLSLVPGADESAGLAVQQDDQASGHRPLARPRGTAHRRVDHEQQRRPHTGHQRHVIVPEIRGGATVMDGVFDDEEDDTAEGNEERETTYALEYRTRSDKRWS
jgi:hypothetical protein